MSSARKKKQLPKNAYFGRKVIGRPFTKGGPGTGRQPGQVNRFTTLKASFLEAFSELNSTAGLIAWAKATPGNRKMFYGWLARMLPNDVNVTATIDTQAAIADQLKRIAANLNLPDPTPAEWRELCRKCRAHNGPDRIPTNGPLDGTEWDYETCRKLDKLIGAETGKRILARSHIEDAEEAADDEKAKNFTEVK